jgi:hypothetical protein
MAQSREWSENRTMLPASAAGIAVVLVLVWITPVEETFNSTIEFEWAVGRGGWSVKHCSTLQASRPKLDRARRALLPYSAEFELAGATCQTPAGRA